MNKKNRIKEGHEPRRLRKFLTCGYVHVNYNSSCIVYRLSRERHAPRVSRVPSSRINCVTPVKQPVPQFSRFAFSLTTTTTTTPRPRHRSCIVTSSSLHVTNYQLVLSYVGRISRTRENKILSVALANYYGIAVANKIKMQVNEDTVTSVEKYCSESTIDLSAFSALLLTGEAGAVPADSKT